MNEIICPKCKKAFKVDEAGYADILKQVHDKEFEQQLHERLELAEKDKQNAIELEREKVGNEMLKISAAKEVVIKELKAKLDAQETERTLAVNQAVKSIEKERDALTNQIQHLNKDKDAALKLNEVKLSKEFKEISANKDAEIQNLKSKIEFT